MRKLLSLWPTLGLFTSILVTIIAIKELYTLVTPTHATILVWLTGGTIGWLILATLKHYRAIKTKAEANCPCLEDENDKKPEPPINPS